MRLFQTWKNYVAQVLLERDVPLVTELVREWIVDVHTDFFVEHSETDAERRRERFDAIFDASIDVYLRALAEGYPEAKAREITHIQGSFEFQNLGWGELIEFPPDEREAYHERYEEFFDRYCCSPDRPFGEFTPPGGFPDAPSTPERMNGDYPLADPGLTDDVYVLTEEVDVRFERDDVAEALRGE